jgi:sugar lactone lactonase YvrE
MKKSAFNCALLCLLCMSFPIAAQLEFVQHEVTDAFTKGADVITVDLDQDGDMDIVAVNSNSVSEVACWENDGNSNFTKKTILGQLNKCRSVRSADINDDGDTDLVVAVYGENRIIYLENKGEGTFEEHTVDAAFIGAHTIDIKDVDDDGDPDILCSGFDYHFHNGEIAWWENDGADPINWTKHLVSDRFQQSPFIFGEDMDGDGDMDMIACGELNDEILWWENDGNEIFSEHMVDSLMNGIHTVLARDVDLDGDMDILAAACIGSRVAWYENDGEEAFTKHDLGNCAGALWLDAADLDNDGDNDLFAAPQGSPFLMWWENPGNQQFIKRIIESAFTQSFCVVPTLMDDDDDLDLVAIGWQSNKISWFENKLESLNLLNNPESVVYNSLDNSYLVSNWGDGNIIRIDSNAKHHYFTMLPEQLAGLHIMDGVLYASSNKGGLNGLLGFSLASGELVCHIEIEGKGVLNDITSDDHGNLYITDSQNSKIYRVQPADSVYTLFVDSGLAAPNGIWFDEPNNRLLVLNGQLPYRPIVAVNLEDSTTTIVVETGINSIDGLTADGTGNFYFSSWETDCIYRYDETFTNPPEEVTSGHINPADIFYNQQDDVLAVPNFHGDTLELIPMGTTGIGLMSAEGNLKPLAYPNPFSDYLHLEYLLTAAGYIEIGFYNLTGQLVHTLDQGFRSAGPHSLNWQPVKQGAEYLQPGIYFCNFKAGDEAVTIKIIKVD